MNYISQIKAITRSSYLLDFNITSSLEMNAIVDYFLQESKLIFRRCCIKKTLFGAGFKYNQKENTEDIKIKVIMFDNCTINEISIIKDAIVDSQIIEGLESLAFKKCKGDIDKIQELVKGYKDGAFLKNLDIIE